jgi:hypothetical protein
LSITKSYGNGPAFVRKLGHYREFPLADVPMPENIKNFQAIQLKFALRVKNYTNNLKLKITNEALEA